MTNFKYLKSKPVFEKAVNEFIKKACEDNVAVAVVFWNPNEGFVKGYVYNMMEVDPKAVLKNSYHQFVHAEKEGFEKVYRDTVFDN